MKLKGLFRLVLLFAVVLVSYGTANSQIVDVAKDAAGKNKDIKNPINRKDR
jgi:outer membrane lipoprotein-sorting protein